MSRSVATALAIAGFVLAIAGGAAHGAFPGANGKIAFVQTPPIAASGIYVVNPDGSGGRWLFQGTEPASSPDGTRLAFAREGSVWVSRADGSGATRLTEGGAPAWSPDGTRIVFAARAAPTTPALDLYVMSSDGSGVRRLTSGPEVDNHPAWAPDGSRIAFERGDGSIWEIRPDGTNARPVIPSGSSARAPGVLA